MAAQDKHLIDKFLEAHNIEAKPTMRAQMSILMQAMSIFQDRERTRQEVWKEYGPADKAMHIRSKAARIAKITELDDVDNRDGVDEALDLINYAAFYVRQVEEVEA